MTNLVITVFENNIEAALRALKKRSIATGLLKDIKRHDHYTKPGDAKRRKSDIARKKLRKATKRTEVADRDNPGR